MSDQHTQQPPPDSPLDQARRLVEQSNFAGAERLASEALSSNRHSEFGTELRYVLAVAQRYQQRNREALETLDVLLEEDPGYGRAWQERGHTLLALEKTAAAREAFEEALRHNPALPGSWRALVGLYDGAGLERQRAAAAKQLERLHRLPRELLSVTSMIHEGKLYKAERLCRHFLRHNKHHVEAMRLLALIGNQMDVLLDAEFLLESCVEFAPDYDQARYDFANVLLKMQKFEKAHEQCQILVDRDPDNPAFQALLANAASGIGDYHNAIDLYDAILARSPRQNELHVMRGHALKTVGRVEEAIEAYREAYLQAPGYGDAFWSLANLKRYRFSDGELAHMRERESTAGIDVNDRIHLCFALGKALEDQEDFEGSFAYYDRGNRLKAETVRHKPTHLNIRTQAQIEVCDRDLFEQRGELGFEAPDPIFIVGMPRAGSTLLEQILASHSQVTGTYELPHIIALAQRLRGSHLLIEEQGTVPRYPQILAELEDDYFRRFGEQYIENTRLYRHGAEFFIDKNPNNFFHIGLIRLILPNAKVIDARRHPMSCCFSGFKQLFGQGQEFSYGLESIGNYYREYVGLMDHWDTVLPDNILRVQHEDVIDDLEGQVRRMLDFLELPFERACVDYHQTERNVRTPSSEQVRQPIQTAGLTHWQNYEPWLGPLKEALGPEVRARYGITLDP